MQTCARQVNGKALQHRLLAEQEAREKSTQGERGFLLANTKSVLQQLEYICDVPPTPAAQSVLTLWKAKESLNCSIAQTRCQGSVYGTSSSTSHVSFVSRDTPSGTSVARLC